MRETLGETAIVPGSSAHKAGLKEFDIILDVDDEENLKCFQRYRERKCFNDFNDFNATIVQALDVGNSASNVINAGNGVITVNSVEFTNIGTLNLEGSQVNVATDWNNSSGLGVVNPGTSTVTFNATSGVRTIASGGQAFNNVVFDDGAALCVVCCVV
mgnify:CR=1 FL=1